MEFVIVELDGQRYGLRADAVHEVVRAATITPLPNAPVLVEGIINVRGAVIAVLDIRRRFGLPARALDPSQYFILARAGDRDVALRVDRAVDLVSLDPAEVDRAEPILSRSRHVAGIAKLGDGLVLIHDLATFLSAAEAAAVDDALEAGDVSEARA
ncbi:MAG: chemotaxis protein CheW [Candidatus Lustribacter sp.]|jgi:purine-binding chemotaxis protein CheW